MAPRARAEACVCAEHEACQNVWANALAEANLKAAEAEEDMGTSRDTGSRETSRLRHTGRQRHRDSDRDADAHGSCSYSS